MVVDMAQIFEEQLHALRSAYIKQLKQFAVELERVRHTIDNGLFDSDSLQKLRHTAHSLSGSGATYGFMLVSEVAGRLDRYVQTLIEAELAITVSHCQYIGLLIADLYAAVVTAAQTQTETVQSSVASILSQEPTSYHIAVYDPDPDVAEDIARQINNFGYAVQVYNGLEDFQTRTEPAPAAMITDISLLGTKELAAIDGTPLIVTALRDDFQTRLHAVREGGTAFLVKPIDTGALIDTLDSLTSAHEVEPYRILIIDDQRLLAQTYAATLRQAGMIVSIITNPLLVMASLTEFQPDVVLLDMYMPGCTGIELAMVLRQQAAFMSIPIVFLSAETQLDRQMEALKRGGDDFLTKPIQLDHLIGAVTNRAHRARLLRSAMVRDSLTGLYNHTTTKEHLKREAARAARQQRQLTFAMIDIDRFKSVNDTYGHVAGDHVIKSLARLLQQRLRKTDIVGRYGGEEFALILPDTDIEAATVLLNEMRQRFAQVRQHANDVTFVSTFSCGFATTTHCDDPGHLVSAADRALYEAKRNGRNCVIQAPTLSGE